MDPWEVDTKTLFTEQTVKDPISKLMCKHIQLAARKADLLVLWTDMSIEGENVCFEIIDNVKTKLPEPPEDHILRAKLKSLSSEDIQYTFDNLIYKPNEYDSLSLDAMRTIELKIENAFTILQTKKLLEIYPTLESITNKIVYDP